MNLTIKGLKEKGYEVRLKLLAVHPLISLPGTHVRFEKMKAYEGSGRLVGKEAHDQRFLNIIPTLKSVQAAKLYDRLTIYKREYHLGTIEATDRLVAIVHNPGSPLDIYVDELNKEWSPDFRRYFTNQVNEVGDYMFARKASENEIDDFYHSMLFEYAIPRAQKTTQDQGNNIKF
jgi:hypothetical protein